MKREDFDKVFSNDHRCKVTYRDRDGRTAFGVALDRVQKSVTGTAFVCVDSFVNRVRLADIVSIENTGKPW